MDTMNVEEFSKILKEKGFPDEVARAFQDMEVDGENFVLLSDVELKEHVPIIGHREKIRHLWDSAVY